MPAPALLSTPADTALIGGLFSIAATAVLVLFQQRNRYHDERLARVEKEKETASREDALAVESWRTLIQSALAQVGSVSGELQGVRLGLRRCEEETVPQLQTELARCRSECAQADAQLARLKREIARLKR